MQLTSCNCKNPVTLSTILTFAHNPFNSLLFFPKTHLSPKLSSHGLLTPTPLSSSSSSSSSSVASTPITSVPTHDSSSFTSGCTHWTVVMEKPLFETSSKSDVVDYYVKTLSKVLGSEKEAQMCIYHASWQNHFGFCCDIDLNASRRLASLPGVLSVKPDTNFLSQQKNYNLPSIFSSNVSKFSGRSSQIFAEGTSKYWVVSMAKPPVEVVSKAQVVDYYSQALLKVLGNEKDAQMCIYHVSWQNQFGFCCEIDEECAQDLAGVPGVLSVKPDEKLESDHKDYGGENKMQDSTGLPDSSDGRENIKTKRLFVTGLSFYTSEKTLRAAFEGFGELVEVKIIMDKISKRSKGYAFLEYTTEEAAAAALKEMNGKIINGWMIVVDVAKSTPPRYGRARSTQRV